MMYYNSTDGFSVEFATLNPQGFFFYSLYTVAGYIDPDIGAGSVETNDLFFALHAFVVSSIQLAQIFVYDKVIQDIEILSMEYIVRQEG
jgi:cystinosin